MLAMALLTKSLWHADLCTLPLPDVLTPSTFEDHTNRLPSTHRRWRPRIPHRTNPGLQVQPRSTQMPAPIPYQVGWLPNFEQPIRLGPRQCLRRRRWKALSRHLS